MSELDDLIEDKEQPEQEEQDPVEAQNDEADEADAPDEPEKGGDVEAAETEEADEKPKAKREQRSVPLAAFLEVQNKLKAELEEKSRRLSELEAKAAEKPDYSSFYKKPPEQIPSVYDDEQGYTESMNQTRQAEMANLKFQISLDNGLAMFGQEKVDGALSAFRAAAEQNPMLIQAAESSLNPVREIIQWYETQNTLQKLEQVGGLDAYEKDLRAKIQAELKAEFEKNAQAQTDDEEDDAPVQKPKMNLPGNFNHRIFRKVFFPFNNGLHNG